MGLEIRRAINDADRTPLRSFIEGLLALGVTKLFRIGSPLSHRLLVALYGIAQTMAKSSHARRHTFLLDLVLCGSASEPSYLGSFD